MLRTCWACIFRCREAIEDLAGSPVNGVPAVTNWVKDECKWMLRMMKIHPEGDPLLDPCNGEGSVYAFPSTGPCPGNRSRAQALARAVAWLGDLISLALRPGKPGCFGRRPAAHTCSIRHIRPQASPIHLARPQSSTKV